MQEAKPTSLDLPMNCPVLPHPFPHFMPPGISPRLHHSEEQSQPETLSVHVPPQILPGPLGSSSTLFIRTVLAFKNWIAQRDIYTLAYFEHNNRSYSLKIFWCRKSMSEYSNFMKAARIKVEGSNPNYFSYIMCGESMQLNIVPAFFRLHRQCKLINCY